MTQVDADQVLHQVDRLSADLLEEAAALVRIPSVGGTAGEHEAQAEMARRLGADGLEVDHWLIDLAAIADRPGYPGVEVERSEAWGLVGRLAGSGGGACLMLNGHIDVVPIGDPSAWTVDPFGGELRGGMLYGRGSCDMKAGLVAAHVAVRALQLAGVSLRGDVLLASVEGEEDGGLGTFALLERGWRADACVIAEPTQLDAIPANAGALTFRLHIRGRATHAARRTEGVSAVAKLWPVWRALEALEARRHESVDPLAARWDLAHPLSIGIVRAGDWPSSVPDLLVAEGRLGVAIGEPVETAPRSSRRRSQKRRPPTPGCVTTPSRSSGGEGSSHRASWLRTAICWIGCAGPTVAPAAADRMPSTQLRTAATSGCSRGWPASPPCSTDRATPPWPTDPTSPCRSTRSSRRHGPSRCSRSTSAPEPLPVNRRPLERGVGRCGSSAPHPIRRDGRRRARTGRRPDPPWQRGADGGRPRRTANSSMTGASPAEAPRTPTTVRSLSAMVRESTKLGRPARPMQTTRRPTSTSSSALAGIDASFVASITASHRNAGRVPAVQECSMPIDRANSRDASVTPRTWTSAPCAWAISAARSPMVPGPRISSRSPRAHSRTLHGPVCVAARLDERADRGIERLRHTVERFDRQRHLLGEGSRPAVAHADLVPLRADVVPAIRAALA